MKIFINPGHNPTGVGATRPDPGACSNGLREADIVFRVGAAMRRCLLVRGHSVQLEQRELQAVVAAANDWRADRFVSIHCNSFRLPSANGTETYFYTGSPIGRALAIQINGALSMYFYSRGVKSNHSFYVLKNTTMPAVLVELGFISNPDDAIILDRCAEELGAVLASALEE